MAFGGNTITQIKQMSGRLFERMLAESGIHEFNSAQAHILLVLWQQDGISVRDVSEKTGLAMASLSGMLDRMDKSGLIERVRDEEDRRRVLVYLTDSAKAMQQKCRELQTELKEVYYEDFSKQEIEIFEVLLQRVLHNVENALNRS